MRKLTSLIFATAVLAGGVLTGAAVAAPAQTHHPTATETRSADRATAARHERQATTASSRHESASHAREASDR